MTVQIDELGFSVTLEEGTLRPLLEVIVDANNGESYFVDLEKLQAAIKFLETEANR